MPTNWLLLILFIAFNLNLSAQDAEQIFNEGVSLKTSSKKIKAILKLEEALDHAVDERNIEIQMRCHLELAELKNNLIYYKEALKHYDQFSDLYRSEMNSKNKRLTDSVSTLEGEVQVHIAEIQDKTEEIDSLTTEQLKAELDIQQLEIDNQKQELAAKDADNRKNILLLGLAMLTIVIAFIARGYFRKRKTNITLQNKNFEIIKEQEKSEGLLLNILPKSVAEELKKYGKTTSKLHEDVTVMFTDFVGFTQFSEATTPENLVAQIDTYFSEFDNIMSKHKIEKIKTIGDAYLAVCGIPEAQDEHMKNMILAAKDIVKFVNQHVKELKAANKPYLEIRIGLHSGPLIAGVVGSKKFAYDVWGDTVNIAARMEQAGEKGEINVSETIYENSKHQFNFEYRGELAAKNKGEMKMYFVS
ncbi:adenylate/guanylate cyclase domain-containing protein [Crocinitomix catalasitica]|uniref:adenylate/guanylate cyclase domain-containing protein n=1 Tax=Crocinitomix catalasitica TaxID=184607 RepID=UPI000683E612|nr:adenylate/guanylate cyclase domain-containing protein [Crocinitomix catalasitica]